MSARAIAEIIIYVFQGVLIVFDLTERITFTKASKWIQTVQDETEQSVKYLIGNQCDLTAQRTVTTQEAETFASENGLKYAETSAFSGFGIEEAFSRLINDIIAQPQLWMKPKTEDPATIKIVNPRESRKSRKSIKSCQC